MDDLPRKDLGPYRLEELLGRGGMGEVYRAADRRLGRQVAVKHLPPAAAGDETRRRRFRLEAAALARLSHPAIVQIFDLVEADDGDWIVMEMVEGPTIAELLGQGPLPLREVLDCGRQIAEGLAEAHGQGILHRDLKAENVMLKRPGLTASGGSGQIKILDFGLAKDLQGEAEHLSTSGQILGTLRSMSPEQVRGLPLDARSDLFSLGLMLYEMTTGKHPLRGQGDFDTLQRIAGHPHRPAIELRPETPPRLSALIDRLLEKSPGDRPASAGEVAGELAQIAAVGTTGATRKEPPSGKDLPTVTGFAPLPPRPWWGLGRRRVTVLLLAGVLLASILAAEAWRRAAGAEEAPESPATRAPNGPAAEPDAFALYQEGMSWLARPDKKDHLERAISSFEAALARDESSAAAHAGLALAYRQQYVEGRDPARLQMALAVAERAVRLDADLALARVALGTISSYAGRGDAALRELGVALQLEPGNVEAYRGLGEAHRRQGRFEDAIAAFKTAVSLAPRDHSLHDQLGMLYYRTARYEEATAEISESLALAPDRAEGFRDLAAVYYMQGRLAEAAEAVQKALAIRPDHSLYSNLGTILFAQGLYPPAAAAFEKALQHGGANFYLYWANLGDAERQMAGREEAARAGYAQAIALLRLELEKDPQSPFLRSRLALFRAKRGDCAETLAELAELSRLEGNQAEDLYRLAVSWEVCGERKAALATLGAALAAGYPPAQVRSDPELFGLRSDPGYRRALGERR
jgi:tetratricopeptide (TPR) repeat protein